MRSSRAGVLLACIAGALALASLGVLIADRAGVTDRAALLGGYISCEAGAASVSRPPLFAVTTSQDGDYAVHETATVTVPAGSRCGFGSTGASGVKPVLTIDGSRTPLRLAATAPIPSDGRGHRIDLSWHGATVGLNRSGLASSTMTVDVLSEFPLAKAPGAVPTDGHYLDSPGAELNVTVPSGDAVDATPVDRVAVGYPSPTVYAGRVAVFGVAPGGGGTFEYSVRYERPALQAAVDAAPFVLTASLTVLALLAALSWSRRRRASRASA